MYLLAYYGVWWLSHWPNTFNTLITRGSQRDKMNFPEEKQIILLFI